MNSSWIWHRTNTAWPLTELASYRSHVCDDFSPLPCPSRQAYKPSVMSGHLPTLSLTFTRWKISPPRRLVYYTGAVLGSLWGMMTRTSARAPTAEGIERSTIHHGLWFNYRGTSPRNLWKPAAARGVLLLQILDWTGNGPETGWFMVVSRHMAVSRHITAPP